MIKQSILDTLTDLYPYTPISGDKVPRFLVQMISTYQIHQLNTRYKRVHSFKINYYGASIQACSERALELLLAMEYLTLEDGYIVKSSDMHYEIMEGVLHFNVTYTEFINKVKDSDPIMENLKLSD